MDLGLAVGNAVYIEAIFHLPGLGALVWGSLIQSEGFELPVISGVVLTVAFAVVFFNLLVDLIYAWVDPRIRASY
jgi:peptide/nickel transport system permease protein